MVYAGGDPAHLQAAARVLATLSEDLTGDALTATGEGRTAAAAAGDANIAQHSEAALAAIGGALLATAALVEGLSQGSSTASDQLVHATGGTQ